MYSKQENAYTIAAETCWHIAIDRNAISETIERLVVCCCYDSALACLHQQNLIPFQLYIKGKNKSHILIVELIARQGFPCDVALSLQKCFNDIEDQYVFSPNHIIRGRGEGGGKPRERKNQQPYNFGKNLCLMQPVRTTNSLKYIWVLLCKYKVIFTITLRTLNLQASV